MGQPWAFTGTLQLSYPLKGFRCRFAGGGGQDPQIRGQEVLRASWTAIVAEEGTRPCKGVLKAPMQRKSSGFKFLKGGQM